MPCCLPNRTPPVPVAPRGRKRRRHRRTTTQDDHPYGSRCTSRLHPGGPRLLRDDGGRKGGHRARPRGSSDRQLAGRRARPRVPRRRRGRLGRGSGAHITRVRPPRTERSNWDFSLKWCVNHDVEMEPGGALESRCLAFPRARASFLWVCDPVRALVWRRVYLPSRAAWTLPGLVLAGGPSRLSVGGAASRAKGQFGGRARRR